MARCGMPDTGSALVGIVGAEDKLASSYNTKGLLRWCSQNKIDPMSVSPEFIKKNFTTRSKKC